MQRFKISIIGNSVALRNRPHLPNSKNYGQHIEQQLNRKYKDVLTTVNNMAIGRATLIDTKRIEAHLINEFPDLYIINLGVCDASTREIPLWFANLIQSPTPSLLERFAQQLNHHLFKRFRSFFVRLRGKRPWIRPQRFHRYYKELIDTLQGNTNAKIIVLPINRGNDRIEQALPGSLANYQTYNTIIKAIAKNAKLPIISIDDLESTTHYPDGIHYSDRGNEIIAQRLIRCIEEQFELNK